MELLFKIKEIPKAHAPLSRRFPVPPSILVDVLDGTGGDATRAACEVTVEITRDHDEVYARGRVIGHLDVPCARCLEPAKIDVDAMLDVMFTRARDKDESPADADELDRPDSYTHDGLVVAFDAPVRELLIAELPISALCKTTCRGLCAVCGVNRNSDRPCGHPEAPLSDGRGLAALAEKKDPSQKQATAKKV